MNKLSVKLENCYGIKSLSHEFDTSKGRAFLVYAPNGVMKTSFAKVFSDISSLDDNRKPSDTVFPNRITYYSVTDEQNVAIAPNQIFVVEPYQEDFKSTRTATLLVNSNLRNRYEGIISAIEEKTAQVLEKLADVAKIKKNIVQAEITSTFGFKEDGLWDLFEHLVAQVSNPDNNPRFENIAYGDVFNEKVLSFLSSENIRRQLAEYVNRYNELISKSTYFRQGLFDHTNAINVGKSLNDNGFFKANHTVILAERMNQQKVEVTSQSELDKVISAEKQKIFDDPQLMKNFDVIDKAITRNNELRQFRSFLENHIEIFPELMDIEKFREKLWLSYSFAVLSELTTFLSTYQIAKKEIAEIIETAKKEETEWREVVSIFHERFSVPFSLKIVNQHDVILKNAKPSLVFQYKDENDEKEISEDELLKVLSTGERRALYLLNIIFEIQSFLKDVDDKVLIFDDIADSFDYKNKYAIVEYIQSIVESGKFIVIILTHNFDFFRTVQSRIHINKYTNCFMSVKSSSGISLQQASYLNPFKLWRKKLDVWNLNIENKKILIASIPMIRNLAEYMGNETVFKLLTSVLHQKTDTNQLSIDSIVPIIAQVLGINIPSSSEKLIDIILSLADSCSCVPSDESINLENKIILSIAIRLSAEYLMIERINDLTITNNITKHQTAVLYKHFKEKFPNDKATLHLLEKVILMTPETIHLNSFMYEPILDLSDCHLHSLYKDLRVLTPHMNP